MHKRSISLLILVEIILVSRSVLSEELFRNNLQETSKDNAYQERLLAYYKTAQSLPVITGNANFDSQVGYNYATPSGSTPLTVDLNFQNKNSGKPAESDSATGYGGPFSQQSFFIPLTTNNQKRVLQEYIKAVSGNVAVGLSPKESTTNDGLRYALNSNRKPFPQALQHTNWKPLPLQTDYSSSKNFDINQISQDSKKNFTHYSQAVQVNCGKNSSDINLLHPPLIEATARPYLHTPSIMTSASGNNVPSLSALNYRRLKIIKSLLTEYLALTQSTIEQQRSQTNSIDNANAGNTAHNNIPTHFQAYSTVDMSSPPASNEFSEAYPLPQQQQQTYQVQPIPQTAIREPHSIYGAPFV